MQHGDALGNILSWDQGPVGFGDALVKKVSWGYKSSKLFRD